MFFMVFMSLAMISIFTFLSVTLLIIWMTLLFSNCLTTYILQKESGLYALKYFLFQELFSSFGVFFMSTLMSNTLFSIILLLKMAIPPFHTWFLKIMNSLLDIKWLMTFSKWIPSLILLLFSTNNMWFELMFLVVMFYFLASAFELKSVFLFSGSINIFWGMMINKILFLWGVTFCFFYLLQSYIIFSTQSVEPFMVLYILGLPPSFFFFFKIMMIFMLEVSTLVLLLYFMMTVVLFIKYLMILSMLTMSEESPVLSSNKSLNNILIVVLLFL